MKTSGVLLSVLSVLAAAAAHGQGAYPVRPVRIIVAVTAGGTSDQVARGVAIAMAEKLGQQIIIENRPSASSLTGTQFVAKAPADGYTLLHMANTFAVAPSLVPNPGYDPLKDFVGVSLTCIVPKILSVNPALPVRSVSELIALVKARPGELTYASAGIGGTGHMAAELFSYQVGLKMRHVPYKGSSQALVDVVGGQVMLMFDEMITSLPYVRGGRLRPLGVTTRARSPLLPDVPTIDEAGVKGFEDSTFTGLVAPVGTPQEVLTRLHSEIARAVRVPELRARYLGLGVELTASASPDQFTADVRKEFEKKAKVIREAKIKME